MGEVKYICHYRSTYRGVENYMSKVDDCMLFAGNDREMRQAYEVSLKMATGTKYTHTGEHQTRQVRIRV